MESSHLYEPLRRCRSIGTRSSNFLRCCVSGSKKILPVIPNFVWIDFFSKKEYFEPWLWGLWLTRFSLCIFLRGIRLNVVCTISRVEKAKLRVKINPKKLNIRNRKRIELTYIEYLTRIEGYYRAWWDTVLSGAHSHPVTLVLQGFLLAGNCV